MILIIDFGSQYNQLIARRVRENHVYCQIEPPDISIAAIKSLNPEGIILSGGPASIYSKGAPRVDKKIFNLGIPVLGICYGLQYMVDSLGGKVIGSKKREYGFAELLVKKQKGIFKGVTKKTQCWMSHGDSIGIIACRICHYRFHCQYDRCGGRRCPAEFLRPAISSGSCSYQRRQKDACQFPL